MASTEILSEYEEFVAFNLDLSSDAQILQDLMSGVISFEFAQILLSGEVELCN